MITTRLFGGLGNQLFQYAAGRALADRLGTELALDRRYVSAVPGRPDGLGHFRAARFTEAPLPPHKSKPLRYLAWRKFGRAPRFQRETALGFNPGFAAFGDSTYLHGYWQSERYFAPIAEALRADLRFTTPLNDANMAMAEQITSAPALSLHVRRGDYVALGPHNDVGLPYYAAALDHVLAKTKAQTKPHVFVFSNDPQWVAQNLPLPAAHTIVDINSENDGAFDLHLMSLCDHNIIANSTFSWWAAWLNANPDKTVVAPRQWFAPSARQNPDICPAGWTRL